MNHKNKGIGHDIDIRKREENMRYTHNKISLAISSNLNNSYLNKQEEDYSQIGLFGSRIFYETFCTIGQWKLSSLTLEIFKNFVELARYEVKNKDYTLFIERDALEKGMNKTYNINKLIEHILPKRIFSNTLHRQLGLFFEKAYIDLYSTNIVPADQKEYWKYMDYNEIFTPTDELKTSIEKSHTDHERILDTVGDHYSYIENIIRK